MLRLRPWLISVVGISVAQVMSCSSDDAAPAPAIGDRGGGGGEAGDTDRGGSPGGSGAATSNAGDASVSGGAAAGGASPGELTDEWPSGARLRAVLDAAGDAKRFKVWHDNELDIDCAFSPDSNKIERCLPIVERGYASYSDTKCTTAVGLFTAGDAIPPYLPEPFSPRECGAGPAYFEVGASVTGVTALFDKSSGSCSPNGVVSATQVVKQLSAVASPATFVARAKTLREPRDSRLEANVRVAEDGSRQVIGFFDLDRKADCEPNRRDADQYACVPDQLAFLEVFFSDAKCKTPAAYYPGCGGPPTIILDSSPGSSGQYFEVGAQLTTPPLFRKDSTICAPYTPPAEPNAAYYAPGQEVPWADFAPLAAHEEGDGRIAVTVLRGANQEPLARPDFFDTELQVPCAAGVAADTLARCIPRTPWSTNVFSDDKCSQALFENTAGAALPDGLAFLLGNAPGGGTAVFQLGPKITAPARAWQQGASDCQERGVSADADYYSTKTIAPSGLAPITREVE